MVSPILANIYLHHVLDVWFEEIVRAHCTGHIYLCRYADDFVCAFQYSKDAQRFYKALIQRLTRFGLEVAEDKTQIIEFSHCKVRAKTKFDFLGFEFRWGVNRWGKPILKRRTSRDKLRASLVKFKAWFQKHSGLPKKILFAKLNRKLLGYYNYYGVTGNFQSLNSFASPLLANLFLHYTFDVWMQKHYPEIPFERYADDGVLHCRSKEQAERLKQVLQERFAACGLELHPLKTRVVYCKNYRCKGDYPDVAFDFLGFTFRPRGAKGKDGSLFTGFVPAISNKAAKAIRQEIRGWELQKKSAKSLDDLARMFNAVIRGWIAYYGVFYRSALNPIWRHLNRKLVLWAARKYKHFRGHRQRAENWLLGVARSQPDLFAHWRLFYGRKLTG